MFSDIVTDIASAFEVPWSWLAFVTAGVGDVVATDSGLFLFMLIIAAGFAAAALGAIIFALIGLLFLIPLIGLGILSASLVAGLIGKSLSAGLRMLSILSGLVTGAGSSAILAFIVREVYEDRFSAVHYGLFVTAGAVSGALSVLLAYRLLFRMLRIVSQQFAAVEEDKTRSI